MRLLPDLRRRGSGANLAGRRPPALAIRAAAFGALVLAALAVSAGAPARRPASRLLRVGATAATIGRYDSVRDPTLAGAIGALGRPSSCSQLAKLPVFAAVTWNRLGLRMFFGSYGVIPTRNPCDSPKRIRLDSAYADGHGWRSSRGLQIGDPVARLRRLYPHAVRKRYPRGIQPLTGWWLVVRTSRVPDLHRFPALLARTDHGRVIEFVVTVQAEGD
jgi:hypothetical protein